MSSTTDTQAIAPQTEPIKLAELYEVDDHLWLEETVKLLRAGNLADLDIENLIEELESLGKRDRHRVESFLQQIIRHLLMLHYWTQERQKRVASGKGFDTSVQRYSGSLA